MKAFSTMAQGASRPGALDGKTKELIALAVSVAIRCDDCIAFHAKAAVEQGANREEVLEAPGMAIYMGAGPAVMYASHAIEAFDQLRAGKSAPRAQLVRARHERNWRVVARRGRLLNGALALRGVVSSCSSSR